MKNKLLLSILACLLMSISLSYSQVSNKINYQAVARNASGLVIQNQNVSVRLSIHSVSSTGAVEYSETHATTTNNFGVFNLKIGNGTVLSGNYNTINWGDNARFLEVEIDPAGGTNFIPVGTSELVSVPHALYSKNADNANNATNAVNATNSTNALNALNATNSTNAAYADSTRQWYTSGNDIINANTGNIGIGTVSPTTAKLVISGNIGQEGLDLSSTDQYANMRVIRNSLFSTDNDMFIGYGSGTTSSLRLFSDNNETVTVTAGKVGIGTASPQTGFDVFSSTGGATFARFGNYNPLYIIANNPMVGFNVLWNSGYTYGDVGSGGLLNFNQELSGGFNFLTAPSGIGNSPASMASRLSITNDGLVGIGTTLPTSDLHIKQSASPFPDPTSGGITFENANGLDEWQVWNSNNYLSFAFQNVRVAYVNNSTGAWTTTSDARYKKNIEPMGNVLDKVMKLNVSRYNYIQNKDTQPKTIGFIAQEVQKIFPDLVYTEDGTQLAIDRSDFAILSIKAIQEQQKLIEIKNSVISDQQKQIDELKARMDKFEKLIK